jgi:murein DD-endopeptidase MepM/ murein hydrolase activator NlpD
MSAQDAGLSDNLTMEIANIFGWDIDFALDIRKGDAFTVLYEELYLDGEKIDDGNILAAEFVNNGRTYQAVRYTDAGGHTDYYSLDGKSMRKQFLRTPVSIARISSRFNLKRKHPILNKIRAHKGVDYAAARGTPIKATANGRIVHRGKKGGYGNTIIIQHGSKYSTLYAHLSKYRGGLKKGSRVKQGQEIGYVGSSGLATGPHLHYELRVNGVHRDPLRVKLPGAEPLDRKYLDDFMTQANTLLARLDLVRNVQVASNE